MLKILQAVVMGTTTLVKTVKFVLPIPIFQLS